MLARAIAGLARQSRPADRVLIVDNASVDDSLARIEHELSNLEIVRSDRNLGFAAANNLAFERLRDCEWIALLNPDAIPDPRWLEELLRAAHQNPNYAFFGSLLISSPQPDRFDGAGDIYHVGGFYWRQWHGRPREGIVVEQREIFAPCAAAAMYSNAALRDVGGFDESFFCYGEDVDLAFRLRLRGFRCLLAPLSIAAHEGSGIAGRASEFAIYHGDRNLIWVYFKNMTNPYVWIFLPLHLALNIARLFVLTARGKSRVIWRAKLDAIRALPRILRARAVIQGSRRIPPGMVVRHMQRDLLSLLDRKNRP